jgi:pSer/pThr/pTyr-binding forkhead associated (FHA) protein
MQKLIIGRSNEATLKLIHPSISRKHCVIEKRKIGYVARNISTTNPLYLNDQTISERRLFSGDQLRLGTFSITFISDSSGDTRQATQKIITKTTRSYRGIWLAAMLIMGKPAKAC